MRVLLMACACGLVLFRQSDLPELRTRTVPAAALSAADAGVLPMAFALAGAQVPLGIVTTDNPSDPAIFVPSDTATTAVTAEAVVTRFAARHPEYVVRWAGSTLSIDQRDLACAGMLDSMRPGPATISGDMPRLLVLLGWLASGDPPPVPSGVISRVAARSTVSRPMPTIQIALPGTATLRSAFDDVVRLSAGGAWIVWQHDLADGSVGCRSAAYYPDGVSVGAAQKDFRIIKAAQSGTCSARR